MPAYRDLSAAQVNLLSAALGSHRDHLKRLIGDSLTAGNDFAASSYLEDVKNADELQAIISGSKAVLTLSEVPHAYGVPGKEFINHTNIPVYPQDVAPVEVNAATGNDNDEPNTVDYRPVEFNAGAVDYRDPFGPVEVPRGSYWRSAIADPLEQVESQDV